MCGSEVDGMSFEIVLLPRSIAHDASYPPIGYFWFPAHTHLGRFQSSPYKRFRLRTIFIYCFVVSEFLIRVPNDEADVILLVRVNN